MIQNIEKYGHERGISQQDALQVFMQAIVLKNLKTKGISLIGGTALVMGHGNPRFSEDIDLTGLDNPQNLKNGLKKSAEELGSLLGARTNLTPPKPERVTWRLSCEIQVGLAAQLHIDTQSHSPITHHPLMIIYPGLPPFVFPSVELMEIMADKLIALAFRNYASGRDIFDLWFHWFRDGSAPERERAVLDMVSKKISTRRLEGGELLKNLRMRMSHGISKRVADEWGRYLPSTLKNSVLYKNIFDTVSEKIKLLKL